MKCCVSTDVGTWTNLLTFEPDPDYSPDAGTGLLSPLSYKLNHAEFYVGKIPHLLGAARRCSDAWFSNGFIQSPVKTTLSEVHAPNECPSSSGMLLPETARVDIRHQQAVVINRMAYYITKRDVETPITRGGQFCCSFVANLLQYLCAKNYQIQCGLTKLLQK